MTKQWPRLTASTQAVLNSILAADDDDPAYGLRVCEETDLGPGTVYPILERLAEIGWLESTWEDGAPSGRPRRRYYKITGKGRVELAAARAAREARKRRWSGLFSPSPAPGGTA